MPTDHDAQLARIQALLAKAESTTFPEEAKALTAKAYELMQKWAIDDAMLAHHRKASGVDPEIIKIDMPYSPFKGPKEDLLCDVAKLCDCKPIITSARVKNRNWRTEGGPKYRHVGYVQVIGFPQDVRFVEMLYTSLLLQAEVEFLSTEVQGRMADECSHPGHRTRWRNTFQDGFNYEVTRRIRGMRRTVRAEAETATPGTGLVLADKADKVQAAFKEAFPDAFNINRTSGRQESTGSAGALGRQAGARADVGGPKVSEGKEGGKEVKGAPGMTSLGSLLP